MNYENFYTTYYQLNQICKTSGYYGRLSKFHELTCLFLDQEMINFFQELGLIIIYDQWFLFLERHNEGDIDLYYYYHHHGKLSHLMHQNSNIRFIIHWFMFNINIYRSIDQVILHFIKQYEGVLHNLNLEENDFQTAHNFLIECEIIQYHKCKNSHLFEDQSGMIDLKGKWYFINQLTKTHSVVNAILIDRMDYVMSFLKRYLTLNIQIQVVEK
jgi:hypothetical protein